MQAWSNFQAKKDDETGKWGFTAKPGDEVSQSDLGVDDDEWDAIVKSGAVREQDYPEALVSGEYLDSPNKYFIDQLAKAAEGGLSGDEVKELQGAGMLPQDVEVPVEQTKTGAAAAKK